MLFYILGEIKRDWETHQNKTIAEKGEADWRRESREFGERALGAMRRAVTDEMANAHANGLCVHQTVAGLHSAAGALLKEVDQAIKFMLLTAAQ